MYSDKLGIPYLSRSLNKILIQHIQRCIPVLNKQINIQLQENERKLQNIEENEIDLGPNKGPMIIHIINLFLNNYSEMIEGKFIMEIAQEC